MIVGTGIDIIKNSRIEQIKTKYENRFLQKIYTENELEYCLAKTDYINSLAARFAAKEAVFKALGTGLRNNSWQEVEIINDQLGKPTVKLTGKTADYAASLEVEKIFLSISHEKNYSIAQIILEGGN
ncbi:holo-ACP synthase [Halanaerobium salsuginis]|jgi:holo-[acyl-carrier protein] synthase|uniref:Holo-[acyl-carrier-protein] synthase n=1 Tax=Halanaerobium salsuginis TaxID=29563 RepID=A0A1I4LX95_9FIRM|nr:holo-ACP synthase [Halanaerobium salsuginis]SFL95463.1 holo-[acyl-carrier protein] synthase [Halanaerobium salsuginis]